MANNNASKAMQAFEKVADNSSSNINEVVRAVLNSLLFFYEKICHAPKAQKASKVPKAQKRNQAKAQKRK